jgi:hypothetical protein
VERVQSQRSKAGSEKSEKRKSGFFGFGRKDKDKDKKEDERRESLQSVREQEPQVSTQHGSWEARSGVTLIMEAKTLRKSEKGSGLWA